MVSFTIQSLFNTACEPNLMVMIEAVIRSVLLFQCDPYVKISTGRKTHDDRDNYKPNTLNPEFGR